MNEIFRLKEISLLKSCSHVQEADSGFDPSFGGAKFARDDEPRTPGFFCKVREGKLHCRVVSLDMLL